MALEAAKDKKALEWLLEEAQPSMRYLTLSHLLERPEEDSEVQATEARIPEEGWVAEIFAKQDEQGRWAGEKSIYRPEYLSANWMLLVLADLGMTKEEPRIAKACRHWIDRFAKDDGGFGMDGSARSHLCVVGNTARALVLFGYADHPKVRSAFEWMVKNASHLGGWSCFGGGRNLDSWEPMSAFAVYPRSKWTAAMQRTVDQAAEFFLQRELHVQGDHYEPWDRFHYPVHYYYDLLVGLDFMTGLGYTDDPRLKHAVGFLEKKRRSDGRWNLDAVHPDLEGPSADWYRKHPKDAPTPFALEKVGEPSKMITWRAMRVLARLEAST